MKRIPIPYQSDSLALLRPLRPLGNPILLDSGSGYPDHLDILAAAPSEICVLHEPTSEGFTQAIAQIRTTLDSHKVVSDSDTPGPGWFGVWGYDLGQQTESVACRHESVLPLMWMGFYPVIILNDHKQKTTSIVSVPGFEVLERQYLQAFESQAPQTCPQKDLPPFSIKREFEPNLSDDQYRQRFEQVKHYILEGDCYQINLALGFHSAFEGDPFAAYCHLRQHQTAPMGAYLETGEWSLLSFSPERFIRSERGRVETKPIKGTRPRSDSPVIDQQNRESLMISGKDQAENLMIVDLLRNDLGRTCVTGSIKVDKLFAIESFPNVHHMVSTVSGHLKPDTDNLTLLTNAFPGGSITGAPKHRAMEIIAELEAANRGFYCGSLIRLDVLGGMDSSILIRSLVAADGQISCWGGGGIVADSTCEQEFQEIRDKVGIFLSLLSQPAEL